MKNSNHCPKCGSENITSVKATDSMGIRISTGMLSIAQITHYVCCDCGFIEEWIENKSDLEKIQNKNTVKKA